MNLLNKRNIRSVCQSETGRTGNAHVKQLLRIFFRNYPQLFNDSLLYPGEMTLIFGVDDFIFLVGYDGLNGS